MRLKRGQPVLCLSGAIRIVWLSLDLDPNLMAARRYAGGDDAPPAPAATDETPERVAVLGDRDEPIIESRTGEAAIVEGAFADVGEHHGAQHPQHALSALQHG